MLVFIAQMIFWWAHSIEVPKSSMPWSVDLERLTASTANEKLGKFLEKVGGHRNFQGGADWHVNLEFRNLFRIIITFFNIFMHNKIFWILFFSPRIQFLTGLCSLDADAPPPPMCSCQCLTFLAAKKVCSIILLGSCPNTDSPVDSLKV